MSDAIVNLILKFAEQGADKIGEAAGEMGLLGGETSKAEGELTKLEGHGGTTAAALGGIGGAANDAEKDVSKLAGDAEGGSGGGIGGLIGGLGGLVSPTTIAVGALGGLVAVGGAALETYDKVEVQVKSLDTALTAHGIDVASENTLIAQNTSTWESYGYTLDDVRPALTLMTEAGISQAQQFQALPAIMDLARAKNIDLATATSMVTKGIQGSSRALTEYGIKLPPASNATKQLATDQKAVETASTNLTKAQDALQLMEDSLKGKTTLTAAEQLKLKLAHDAVTTASNNLKTAQSALATVTSQATDNSSRFQSILQAITGATGDQRSSISELAPVQATLSDKWEEFATTIGPGVENIIEGVLSGLLTLINVLERIIGIAQQAATVVNKAAGPGGVGTALSNSPIGEIGGAIGSAVGFLSGSHAAGLDYVPHDNYIAALHQGEMVVPAAQAAQVRAAGTVGSGGGARGSGSPSGRPLSLNLTITGAALFDPYGVAAQQLAQLLIPGLSRELNRQGTSLGSF